jgi:hypothetical protein
MDIRTGACEIIINLNLPRVAFNWTRWKSAKLWNEIRAGISLGALDGMGLNETMLKRGPYHGRFDALTAAVVSLVVSILRYMNASADGLRRFTSISQRIMVHAWAGPAVRF